MRKSVTKISQCLLAASVVLVVGGVAQADAGDDARRQVSLAQAQFSRVAARVHVNNPLVEEIRQARGLIGKAYKRLSDVRREIAGAVNARPEVRELSLKIREIDEQLAKTKNESARLELAAKMLQLRKQRTVIHAAACSGNLQITIAQADFQDAVNRLRAAEMEYSNIVRSDPDFESARQQLAAVRSSVPRLSYALGG